MGGLIDRAFGVVLTPLSVIFTLCEASIESHGVSLDYLTTRLETERTLRVV